MLCWRLIWSDPTLTTCRTLSALAMQRPRDHPTVQIHPQRSIQICLNPHLSFLIPATCPDLPSNLHWELLRNHICRQDLQGREVPLRFYGSFWKLPCGQNRSTTLCLEKCLGTWSWFHLFWCYCFLPWVSVSTLPESTRHSPHVWMHSKLNENHHLGVTLTLHQSFLHTHWFLPCYLVGQRWLLRSFIMIPSDADPWAHQTLSFSICFNLFPHETM